MIRTRATLRFVASVLVIALAIILWTDRAAAAFGAWS